MRRSLLPVLLFLLAAGGAIFLGSRILASERSSAERTARERLRAKAREAAGDLVAEASRLLREAATGVPDAIRAADGTFLRPTERRPLVPLAPARERDPEADFYMAEAERAEAIERDLDRAAALYQAAAADGRDRDHRLLAFFRHAALERRRGNETAASTLESAFLGLLPESLRATREALVVRARSRPPDPALRGDLLLLPGGNEDALVEGFLRNANLDSGAAMAIRREEIRIMEWVGSSGPPAGKRMTFSMDGRIRSAERPQGVRIHEGRILAWARGADGTERYRIGGVPVLPTGVYLESGGSPAEPPGIVEAVDVGDPLPGERIGAFESMADIEAEARRGAWMLGGALAALLCAGGAATFLSVSAARREAAAARARADFVTRVGHDLRTPLAVVRMYAETLAAGKVTDPAEAREFAGIAAREAGRLTGMVDQVLDLSRVAELSLPRVPLDLAALAAEVSTAHRPLLENAGVRFEVRAAGPLPVLGDSASLRGAVSNLLENALRHAVSGGSVEIEAARDGTMAVVRVLDRGPGLPAGLGGRIFERFVRGPAAAGSGAGIGLALVREAAEAHGGSARAADREGGGAAFAVAVPLAEEGA